MRQAERERESASSGNSIGEGTLRLFGKDYSETMFSGYDTAIALMYSH